MVLQRLSPRFRIAVYNVLVSALYAGTADLSIRFALSADQATLIWPPAGIALAFCVRAGVWCWPGVAVGAFAVGLLREPFLVAAALAGGSTLGAVVGAVLLRRAGFDPGFTRRRDVGDFVSLGVLGSTLISPSVATLALWLTGRLYRPTPWDVWREWWLGDAAGVLIVAPPLLLWTRARLQEALRGHAAEAVALAAVLVATAYAVFFDRFEAVAGHLPLVFLTFPLLVWASLRFKAIGATTAVLIVSATAIAGTALGHGPLVAPDPTARLSLLWAYVGVSAGVVLLLTALDAERDTLVQGMIRDIAERREAEAALEASRRRERLLLDQVPAVLWTTDIEGRFTSVVGSGLGHYGMSYADVVGKRLEELIDEPGGPSPVLPAFERARAGQPQTYETLWQGIRFQCELRPLHDDAGGIAGTIGVGIDITEQRALQEQLLQAQKIESVGQLAGGIAHDFNNLLQVIQGYTLLARDPAVSFDERQANLGHVLTATERASQLTRQLLMFARRQPMRVVDVDLVDLVGQMLNLIRRLIGADIEIRIHARVAPAHVRCDPAQIEQVLLNLCLNARDALPGGGDIDVVIDNEPPPRGVAVGTEGTTGAWVRLLVRDNGVGMNKATLEHIFEPFFTTKPQGAGTGLGLSVVYGIVRQHEGLVAVESEPGGGATFMVWFRAVTVSRSLDARDRAVAAAGGPETILLAEDEPSVRDLATRVLMRAGYRVLAASDGEEAVRLFEEHADEIDLAVLDVVMPKCGGVAAYERLVALRANLPVLFCSGYAGLTREHDAFPEELTLLPKPYTPDELLRSVRERIAASRRR